MADDLKKPLIDQVDQDREDLEDEEEMRRARLNNPPDPCGPEADRFGK